MFNYVALPSASSPKCQIGNIYTFYMCHSYKIAYWQNQGGDLSDVQASMYIEVGIQYPVQGIPLPIGGAGLLRPSVAVLLAQHHWSTSDDHSNIIISMILFASFFFLSHSGRNAPSLGYSSDKLSLTLTITSWFLPIVASDVCWLWRFLDSSHVKIIISC